MIRNGLLLICLAAMPVLAHGGEPIFFMFGVEGIVLLIVLGASLLLSLKWAGKLLCAACAILAAAVAVYLTIWVQFLSFIPAFALNLLSPIIGATVGYMISKDRFDKDWRAEKTRS